MQTLSFVTIVFSLIGTIQASFLAAMLFLKNRKNKLNVIISALLIILALVVSNTLFILLGTRNIYPFYQDFTNAVVFLIGPLLLSLVNSYLALPNAPYRDFKHYIPFLTYLFATQIPSPLFNLIETIVVLWVWNIQIFVYLIVAIRLVNTEELKKTNDTKWLRFILYAFAFILVYNFSVSFISRFFFPLPDQITLSSTLLLIFLIINIAYRSLGENIIKTAAIALHPNSDSPESIHLLTSTITDQKLYRNPELKLSTMSGATGMSERVISRLINETFDVNFNQYINGFRIEEVLERLPSPESRHLTVMAIAKEAGFKSNSAFYRAFKQTTGCTPTEYLKDKNLC